MKSKILISIVFCLNALILQAQDTWLTKKQVTEDIDFLTQTLNDQSSYAYLNGYDFNADFEQYLNNLEDSTRLEDFGLFITKTLAKIGDRHSSLTTIRGYKIRETQFLPLVYAPVNKKVVVLDFDENKHLKVFNPKYPYLKKIDGIEIDDFLRQTRPEDIKAPEETYFTLAVRDIRDIQKNYLLLNKPLPEEIELTLSDSDLQKDTILMVPVVEKSQRRRPWDEKFEVEYLFLKDEDYNNPEVIEKLFRVEDQIAYVKLPEMTKREETPLLFEKVNTFMESIHDDSKALIIDVRANKGGTRELLYEFAKYLVHPDSVYVVNATKQRAALPLSEADAERLHGRFLYSFSELDSREQAKVNEFLETFQPIYELNEEKYSEYYFGVLNGRKLARQSFYYNKPVYILANEKTFSAASVFVSVFKGIPNIKIVGVTTDGSSGNSEWFDLPHSKLFGKISTMVSFQKDGTILDGYGTQPDILIERDLDQVLHQSDSQLEQLRRMILSQD